MRILSLNWSRSFFGFWDVELVGLEVSTIFLPLSGGNGIMMMCKCYYTARSHITHLVADQLSANYLRAYAANFTNLHEFFQVV